MIHKIRQGARALSWHWSLIGLVVGLLWAGIGFDLWHDYKVAELNAAKDTANLARSFDENITRTVEAVDQTLLFVRESYQHDRAGFVLGSWARGRGFLDELHLQIGLVDRDGHVFWSNLGRVSPEVNLTDREHFQVQKTSRDDSLFISKPVLGRVSGKWTVQFVRKLVAPDGSFDGIVVVSLDPHYLSRFYESIAIGNGSIILATTGGIVLARAPKGEPLIGSELPAEVEARMLRGTTAASYRTVSGFDGVDRILSSRRLERYPLMLAVGLASDDVFSAYERNKRLYLAAGVLLTAASLVVGFVVAAQRRSLLDSRQALTVTLEHISQGIAMIHADGSVAVLNQRAIDLLGLPPALVAGRPTFRQILNWQLANRDFGESVTGGAEFERDLRGTSRRYGDYTYERTRPNGTVLEIRTQGLPDGGIVRTYTDITERKQNETALAAARARAAHAERMQALGQLAGGIAHDFNNILQAVQGSAALMDKRAGDAASVRRFARMILDAAKRGTSITRRLLAFARRGELRAEPVDPASLLTGLRDVLSHTLGSGIEVDVRLEDDLPPLLADKGQLETALVNLATNARDAMPDGGTLTFGAAVEVVEENAVHPAELRPGRYVRLSVTDTGTGIDQPTLARVLEPFFSTKPLGQGTGLGLSMAKGFVEQSGGGLSIDTSPGRGTTVDLWLPATTLAHVPIEAAWRSAPVPDDTGKHILLVDDEAMVRETLAASLEDAGYTVLLAADGSEALDLLDSTEVVDVLVTDLSMPGIDGLAVIRQAQQNRPDLPAVLLTGYAGHGAQLAVGDSVRGAFALVRKPVTAAQLADRIEALLAVSLAG
ncbi:MAG: PAS-domain containing protein [Rhodopila sp.]|nr:PAS-domain containing protein [Rhodopila sp.]